MTRVLPGTSGPVVHNVRVSSTRTLRHPSVTRLVALAAAASVSLGLAACSSADEEPEASPSVSPTTESPTADVSVPDGVELTAQGTDLSFGDSATVVYEPDQEHSSILELTVKSARKGRLEDFKGFILDDPYKRKANYYYVKVAVENVGEENVGGGPVPLWGVNGENTLLPVVNFTTEFGKCASTPLPTKFQPGKSLDTCLVYLSPDKGTLESVSFRPDQAFDPIEWTGTVKPPKAEKKKSDKKKSDKKG